MEDVRRDISAKRQQNVAILFPELVEDEDGL